MDIDAILDNGGYDVRNPNYNPKTKKGRAEQPYLKSSNIGDVHPFITEGYDVNAHEAFMFNVADYDKYINAGINLNTWETTEDWDRTLAERQSAFKKFGNAIAQGVVSEVGLGTLKSITDLLDVVSGQVFNPDNDYTNTASAYLEKLQEDFRNNVAPIYTTPGVNIGNGGLTDAGWWASNLPSVMASLTLLIPSTGITKGVSLLGKGLNAASKGKLASFGRTAYRAMTGAAKANTLEKARKLNGVTKWLNDSNTKRMLGNMAETTFNAALMRTMENYQEARGVYNDMKQQALDKFNSISDEEYAKIVDQNIHNLEGVDTSDKEAVADRLASLSADRTFVMDYANTIFDVIQLNALRNPIKLLKNMRATRAVNEAQRASTTAIGKAATEGAAETAAKETAIKKFGRGAAQFMKDSGVAVKAELSEGVEEAVNYIAQEEGMHFGNVALGEDVNNNFSTRLSSYLRSPELYDAAFWGVAGGVVFQGLGSGFNRLQVAAERKYQQNKKKADSKTGEATNTESWQELFETSENKRRVTDINKRAEDFNTLVTRLNQIGTEENPGVDPFNTDENGQPIALTTEVERSIAREKAISEYITGMTFRAMDNGNFDMLKAYLQDKNIQDALNEATGNEGDGGAFIESLVARMDHIADTYNQNLIALSNISRTINISGEKDIPIEYLQIIARDNTHAQLRLEDMNEQINAYETSIANKTATYGDKLDRSLNYKDTVQLVVLTQQLAQLRARRSELKQAEGPLGVGREIELDRVNESIRIVEDMIKGSEETSNSDALTRLLYATVQANMINDAETYAQNLSDLMSGNIEGILGDRAKDFETSDTELMKVLGEDRSSGAYRTLASDINAVFEGQYGLNNIDKRLGEDYSMLAALNIEKQFLNRDIAMNESSVSKKVNELHNSMLDARKKAIDDASNILKDLAKKYGREAIADNLYDGSEIDWQSEEDSKRFNDAMEMLNLTSASNQQLYDDIQNMLLYDELIRISQEAATSSGESSTTPQNPPAGSQSAGSNNQSATTPQTGQGQGNTLNSGQTGGTQQGKVQQPTNEVQSLIDEINRVDLTTIDKTKLDEFDSRIMRFGSDSNIPLDQRKNNINALKEVDRKVKHELNRRRIQSSNSSTGGQGSNSPTGSAPAVDDNGNPIPDAQREAAKKDISSTLINAVKTAGAANADVTAAMNQAIQDLNAKYGNDEEFKREINRISHSLALRAQKKGWVSDVAAVVALASSVTEQGGKYTFSQDYIDAARTFVDKFLKAANAKEFNGKKLVSFESMLRFANEQMEDNTTAQYIYNSLKAWFEKGPDADKYIVLDNMDSTSIFDRTSKTNKELATERLGGTNVFRVQIDQFLMRNASKAAIDRLQQGDTLNAKVDNGDIILMVGDVEIGRLPQPQGNGRGGFQKTNNGWITDVELNNGNVRSNLRTVWEDILLNKSAINDKINSYIYQIIAANKINADIKPIKDAIEKDSDLSAFFDGLKQQGVIDKKANNVELISGLVSIWNYIDLTSPIEAERQADIAYSLDLWFNKLYDSYAAIANSTTVGVENLTFKVAKITDGDVIQVAANDNQGYDKCTLGTGNEAFANIDTTEIGTVRPGAAGVIQTTANGNHSQPNSSVGTLWAVLPNRSGIPGIVRGHALKFMDRGANVANTPAGRIRQAISDEFERKIKDAVENDNFTELINFIEAALGTRISTPLLAPTGGGKANVRRYSDGKGERIVISLKREDGKYVNFTINQDQRGYNFNIDGQDSGYKGIDELDDFIKDFKTQVLGNSMFNVDFKYLDSDADTSTPLEGLATRDKDGNFVITIPNGTNTPLVETFPSFKHFMMQGGGARWNTKNENGSNFQPRSNNQLRNQVLNVSIESATSRPIEEIDTETVTPDQINSGEAIDNLITKVFGENSAAVKRLQDAGLIPSSIKYTSTISTKNGNPVTAEYVPSKKQIYVNDRWIELYKDNPERALRVLIHEQLHNKLHSKGNRRKEALNRIREIYNDFEKSLEGLPNDAHIREYLFKGLPEQEALEEFLVESLTNRELASHLNSVKVDIPGQKTKKSILDKILELLADIFDWKVTEGSLYEKELRVLQGFTNEEIRDEQILSNNPILDDYISFANEHITFDDETHTYYLDGKPIDYSATQYAAEVYGRPNIEGDYSHSSAIGRSMDAIYRDFFIIGDEVLNKNYPNLNAARKQQILNDLHKLRDYLDRRFGKGTYRVVTNEIPLVAKFNTPDGVKTVAGTIDMLIEDKDGNFHIFDFKAKNHPITRKINGKEGDDRRNYTAQANMYKAILESINPEFKGKVKSLQLIWMDTFYPSLREATFDTDDEGNVTVTDNFSGASSSLESYPGFMTPALKENVEESIIPLQMTEQVEELTIPTMIPIDEEIETPTETETNEDEDLEDEFEDDDIMASSLEEKTTPSVNQFVESLPLEERINFSHLLQDGTVSMKCS